MNKKILALILSLIVVLASAGIIITFTSNQQVRFKNSNVRSSGIVTDFNQAYSLYKTNSSLLKNVAFAIYDPTAQENNTVNKSVVDVLEKQNITLLYEITGNIYIDEINEISKMDFQGVFFNGNIGNYGISSLNDLIDKIKISHGITVINETLLPYVFNVSMINYYFLYVNNFTDLWNYLNSINSKNMFSNVLIDLQNSSMENLTCSIEMLNQFSIRYLSLDFGNSSLNNIEMILSAEEKIDNGPGIVPSRYIIEGTSNFVVKNGDIYVLKSLGIFETNNSISFLNRIIGYNLTFGYKYYSSSEYNITFIVNPLNVLGYAINFGIINQRSFIYIALAGIDENGYELYIQGVNFSLGNSNIVNTFFERYNFSNVIFTDFDIAGNGIVLYNVHLDINSLRVNMLYIDPINKSSWSLNLNYSSKGKIFNGFSTGLSTEDGYIIISEWISFLNITTNNISTLSYSYILSQKNGFILFNFTKGSIIPYTIFSQGNSLLCEIENNSGYWIIEINTTSLQNETLLFSKSEIDGFMLYQNDLITVNGNITRYHNGSIMWIKPAPEVKPIGFGNEFTPIMVGQDKLLIGSEITQESTSYQFYSQEFEIINASTGATLKTFYNNFTLIPEGFPSGLPPSPDVYYPITYIDGLLIYSTVFGKQAIFVSKI